MVFLRAFQYFRDETYVASIIYIIQINWEVTPVFILGIVNKPLYIDSSAYCFITLWIQEDDRWWFIPWGFKENNRIY
jgi:hypothetical protein